MGTTITFIANIPCIYDKDWWCILTDLSLCLMLVVGRIQGASDATLLADIAWTERWQMALVFAAAGLWKLNWDFVDERASCASIFVSQWSVAYLPAEMLIPTSPLYNALL